MNGAHDPTLASRREPNLATAQWTPVAPDVGDTPTTQPPPEGDLNVSTATRDADAPSSRPWLGIEMAQADSGVLISAVYPGSPAHRAGLQLGDTLQRLGEVTLQQPTDVHTALAALDAGKQIAVTVSRNGEPRLFRLVLSPRPTLPELLTQLHLGKPAPSISSLQAVQGSVIPSFEQLRGQVVVLEFWASWCMACRALTPELNRWNRESEVLGLRVLAVTTDPRELAKQAASQFDMEFSVHIDEDASVTKAYHASAVPTLFVVDKRGIVRDIMVGFDVEKLPALYQLVNELLDES